MFCPGCGLQETHSNQFCRACGTDLRPVRLVLEQPDNITASAASARDEIGRAVAAKIRETQSAHELKKVAEDVLPEIEKFLESPEEKRLRRLRTGTIISSIGMGVVIALTLVGMLVKQEEIFFLAGLGMITFFIGLGFLLNGLFLTVPKKSLADKSEDATSQRELDVIGSRTSQLVLPEANKDSIYSSVTEHTTHQLKKKEPVPRK
jgi:hypothetical protein